MKTKFATIWDIRRVIVGVCAAKTKFATIGDIRRVIEGRADSTVVALCVDGFAYSAFSKVLFDEPSSGDPDDLGMLLLKLHPKTEVSEFLEKTISEFFEADIEQTRKEIKSLESNPY